MTSPGLHALHLRNEARRATIATLGAANRPFFVTVRAHPTNTLLVHLDPSKPGRWRVTHMDAATGPTGHVEAPDCASATLLASDLGT